MEAQRKYSQALHRVREVIVDKETALSDEMIITVMVMAGYENHIAHFDQTKLYSYCFEHHQGATVLLKIRQERRVTPCPPSSIDQCIRRQVMNGCVYRSIPVPDWLHNGLNLVKRFIC